MIKRDIFPEIMTYMSGPEAIVIVGMRRVGKTTLLHHIMSSIPSKNVCFFDLENPIHRKLFESDNYEAIVQELTIRGLNISQQSYLFLDEIQFCPTLPSVAKYLIDHYNIKCVLTGSSAFYIKNRFTESMSGRKYIFELYPFNFNEFLQAKAPHLNISTIETTTITESLHQTLNPYYEEFLRFGGFPSVVLKTSEIEKRKTLEDIFTSFFNLEIMQFSDFRKSQHMRDLILLMMERVGSKADISKLASELQLSRPTVIEYLSYLEQVFFLQGIPTLSSKHDRQVRQAKKYYLCDNGFLTSFSKVPMAVLFENMGYLQLRQRGTVTYYQSKNNAEIDFIVDEKKGYELKQTGSQTDISHYTRLGKTVALETCQVASLNWTPTPSMLFGFQL